MSNIIINLITRFHELFYQIRDIRNILSFLYNIPSLKDNFDSNLVVVDDPIDIFVLKNNLYIKNKKNGDINRRLFITTGGISLLTAITIRKTSGTENAEDYLLIETQTKHNLTFLECNTNIAKLYNFKKIIFMQGKLNYDILINYGLTDIDEIYMVSHYKIYYYIKKLYPQIKYTLFEEGPGTISCPIIDYTTVIKIIAHNYIKKFDYFFYQEVLKRPKIEYINAIIFRQILKEVREELGISINLDKNTKYILLCGPDIDAKKNIKIAEIYKIVEKLEEKGYMILFKKHPRDPEPYKFNENVLDIKTSYPIELYDLNIVAMVSFSSSICITVPFFNEIAVFSDMNSIPINRINIPSMSNLTRFIIKQYTVPIKILFDFDHRDYNALELKKELFKIFNEYIAKLPNVSDNKVISKYLVKNRKYLHYKDYHIW